MRVCKKCGEDKPIFDYYKHPKGRDGYDTKCKICAKKIVMAARDANIDAVRAYDRNRSKLPHRLALNAETTRRYREKNKKRTSCNRAVSYALKTGKLKKQPCWICGSEKVEGYHPDYDSPLDVVWLCHIHHKEIHLRHPR